VWLLDAATLGSVGALPGSFVSELLPWGLSSSVLSGSLLCSCHSAEMGLLRKIFFIDYFNQETLYVFVYV
jgi:hypothetical protein